jgi:hypothetical protein
VGSLPAGTGECQHQHWETGVTADQTHGLPW